MKRIILVLGIAFALAGTEAYCQGASDKGTSPSKAQAADPNAKQVGNKHCPIMPDEEVSENSKTVTYKGQVVRVCCNKCIRKFNASPDEYLKKAQDDAKGN